MKLKPFGLFLERDITRFWDHNNHEYATAGIWEWCGRCGLPWRKCENTRCSA